MRRNIKDVIRVRVYRKNGKPVSEFYFFNQTSRVIIRPYEGEPEEVDWDEAVETVKRIVERGEAKVIGHEALFQSEDKISQLFNEGRIVL